MQPSFRGPQIWASNMYPWEDGKIVHEPAPIIWQGLEYATAEHLFQAGKYVEETYWQLVRKAPTPYEAKKLGRAFPVRPGWDRMKLDVMLQVVRAKFNQHEFLAELLIKSDAYLVELNTWNDRFWGKDIHTQDGENWLGRILMIVREELIHTRRMRKTLITHGWNRPYVFPMEIAA